MRSRRGSDASDDAATERAAAPDHDRGLVEEAARAGIGLAVDTVGLGFKIAGRALEAVRDAGRRG